GVRGLGRLGSLYAEYLEYQISRSSVIAVTDVDDERAQEIGEKLNIQHRFSDYRDMLELDELDAIVITTPTSTHNGIVLDGAAKGAMIFCEKPLSISIDDAVAMSDAIEHHGSFFHMGFMRR